MSEKNTTQNLVTVVSIVIALVAVTYALMVKLEKPQVIDMEVQTQAVQTYTVGEDNPVVMSINGENITRIEILDNFSKSGSQIPQGMNLTQIFPLLQEQYLVGALIKDAADKRGIDADHPKVQERLNEVLDQALRAAYIDEVGKETITDTDIEKAYEDIIGNASLQMERKARHILLKDQSKANALIVKLNQGADFAKLAEKESTGPTGPKGGDLGYFAKGEMVPEFERAAFDLEIGKFTQKPIKTQFGYHIIMVDDERERAKPTFEEVKDQLGNQLRQAATAEAIQELRKNAEVTIYDFKGEVIEPVKSDETLEEEMSDDKAIEDNATNDVVKPEPVTE